jgi:hypothetical protein
MAGTPVSLRANNRKQAFLDQGLATNGSDRSAMVFTAEGKPSVESTAGRRPPYRVEVGHVFIEVTRRDRDLVMKIWRFTKLNFSQRDGEWSVEPEWILENTFGRKNWQLRVRPELVKCVNLVEQDFRRREESKRYG